MGLALIDAVIRSPFTDRAVAVKALAGTGIILTVVPRRVADELQLPVIGRRRIATAKGVTELDECIGVVEVMGRKAYTHILVSDDVDTVLIGVCNP
jgi:aspartyl protease family protein